MTIVDDVVEYFTLERAIASASKHAEGREAALQAFIECRQKRVSSERLLLDGSLADAVRIGKESAALAQATFEHVGGESRAPSLAGTMKDLDALVAEIGEAPALDADVTGAQTAALRTLLVTEYRLERKLEPLLRDRSGLLRLRVVHGLRVAACALLVWVVGRVVHEILYGARAEASSELSAMYGAERAIDNDITTDWIPQTTGNDWIEITFRTSRRVHTIRLLNGHAHVGHATGDVHVELYDDAALVRSVDGSFNGYQPTTWLILDGGGVKCTRVRITAKRSSGVGPALAEAVVD